jgi:hypothetical protein
LEGEGVAMNVKPTGMLLMMLAGWINRHQQDVIMEVRVSPVQVALVLTKDRLPSVR